MGRLWGCVPCFLGAPRPESQGAHIWIDNYQGVLLRHNTVVGGGTFLKATGRTVAVAEDNVVQGQLFDLSDESHVTTRGVNRQVA